MLTSAVTRASLPIRLSTFVLTVEVLIYRTASGRVRNSNMKEITTNTSSWTGTGAPKRAATKASAAPPANQMVVRAVVMISMPTSITKAMSQ